MRLPRSLCAIVGDALAGTGSHSTLDRLFLSAGAPGPPPEGPHTSKWKDWLFRAGQDEKTDSLAVLGGVLEEFMDRGPQPSAPEFLEWKSTRESIESALEESGLRYFRFGRVLAHGDTATNAPEMPERRSSPGPRKPTQIEEVVEVVVKGLRRAMHPLTQRRKGTQALVFGNEYDVQDLLHALLRPWIRDIRPEEFTPSYAGSSTRMDFLLPDSGLVIETKIVRDRSHAKNIGTELIIDIAHYRKHPACKRLWCVIYDPDHLIPNGDGLKADLEGPHFTKDGEVEVRVIIV